MKIMVLFASARPGRQGEIVATWVARETAKWDGITVDLVDAAALELPFYNEIAPPLGLKEYANPKGTKWAERVGETDAIIFVVAEYNHGYTGLMKNTIDWVGREWAYKPVAFVSYGADAGGARAVEQLKQVVVQLKMLPVTDPSRTVTFPHVYKDAFNEQGEPTDSSKVDNLNIHLDELIRLTSRLQVTPT